MSKKNLLLNHEQEAKLIQVQNFFSSIQVVEDYFKSEGCYQVKHRMMSLSPGS